jgi:autoinducer 2-degrading protein
MSRLVIFVSFTLKRGARDRFLALVKENAAASVREEPGCFRFDVLTPMEGESVVLYEIYADAAAFDHHLTMPHLKSFDAATRDLVEARTIGRYAVIENDKGMARGAV